MSPGAPITTMAVLLGGSLMLELWVGLLRASTQDYNLEVR